MSDTETLRDFNADPERRLRCFVARRADELGRMAGWIGGLLAMPRRGMDAARARLDAAKLAELADATARAMAWAKALRRRMMAIDRAFRADLLEPQFSPAPEEPAPDGLAPDGPAVTGRTGRGDDDDRGGDGGRAALPAPGFEPMTMEAIREALKRPFLAPAVLEAMARSVQARAAAVTSEIAADLRRRRQEASRPRWRRTPADVEAEAMIATLPFAQSIARICAELIGAATALGATAVAARVRAVSADLAERCAAMAALREARARAAAEAAAEDEARARAAMGRPAPPVPIALRLAGLEAALFPTAARVVPSAVRLPAVLMPGLRVPAVLGSFRAALESAAAIGPPAFAMA